MQPNPRSNLLSGGRRMGRDRREYAYALCIPERRSGIERRSGKDRRHPDRIFSMQVPTIPNAAAHSMRS
jgi:hypothetical protein